MAQYYSARFSKSRCIAPDLTGFGDSGKVSGVEYPVKDHQRYLDEFLDKVVPTEKIVLVVHDWGSALGFDWARRHPDRVAGLAFIEFIPPTDSWDELNDEFSHSFKQFGDPSVGRKLLIDQNVFIEVILQRSIARRLGEEMDHYRRPFLEPESREPIYRFLNGLPVAGEPAEVWDKAQNYMAWLLSSEHPKLFFGVSPGKLVGDVRVKKLNAQLKNTRSVHLGKGFHFVQEDYPHEIGREIAEWLPPSMAAF